LPPHLVRVNCVLTALTVVSWGVASGRECATRVRACCYLLFGAASPLHAHTPAAPLLSALPSALPTKLADPSLSAPPCLPALQWEGDGDAAGEAGSSKTIDFVYDPDSDTPGEGRQP
jgi:hypothetical protein